MQGGQDVAWQSLDSTFCGRQEATPTGNLVVAETANRTTEVDHSGRDRNTEPGYAPTIHTT